MMKSEPGTVVTGFLERLKDKDERQKTRSEIIIYPFAFIISTLRNPVTTFPVLTSLFDQYQSTILKPAVFRRQALILKIRCGQDARAP
jgi:hypothetical protein